MIEQTGGGEPEPVTSAHVVLHVSSLSGAVEAKCVEGERLCSLEAGNLPSPYPIEKGSVRDSLAMSSMSSTASGTTPSEGRRGRRARRDSRVSWEHIPKPSDRNKGVHYSWTTPKQRQEKANVEMLSRLLPPHLQRSEARTEQPALRTVQGVGSHICSHVVLPATVGGALAVGLLVVVMHACGVLHANKAVVLLCFALISGGTLAFAAAGLAQLWHFEPQTSTKLPVALKLPLARRTSVQLHQRRREHERSLLALPGFALFALLLALVLSHAPQPFAPPIADVSTDPNDVRHHAQRLDSTCLGPERMHARHRDAHATRMRDARGTRTRAVLMRGPTRHTRAVLMRGPTRHSHARRAHARRTAALARGVLMRGALRHSHAACSCEAHCGTRTRRAHARLLMRETLPTSNALAPHPRRRQLSRWERPHTHAPPLLIATAHDVSCASLVVSQPPSFAPIASDTHAATADRLARNVSRLPSVAPPPPHNTSDATIEMIQHAFPRLRTLHTTLPPAAALSRAHNVCTALHWHVVATSSLPNDRFVVSGADLRLLATRRSFLLIHDVSDLAIRGPSAAIGLGTSASAPLALLTSRVRSSVGAVRAASAGHAGSRVDVRSRSRDRDGGDLGQNAEVRARCSTRRPARPARPCRPPGGHATTNAAASSPFTMCCLPGRRRRSAASWHMNSGRRASRVPTPQPERDRNVTSTLHAPSRRGAQVEAVTSERSEWGATPICMCTVSPCKVRPSACEGRSGKSALAWYKEQVVERLLDRE
jgi:hypothetical protein